jgi:hypothetical protein
MSSVEAGAGAAAAAVEVDAEDDVAAAAGAGSGWERRGAPGVGGKDSAGCSGSAAVPGLYHRV